MQPLVVSMYIWTYRRVYSLNETNEWQLMRRHLTDNSLMWPLMSGREATSWASWFGNPRSGEGLQKNDSVVSVFVSDVDLIHYVLVVSPNFFPSSCFEKTGMKLRDETCNSRCQATKDLEAPKMKEAEKEWPTSKWEKNFLAKRELFCWGLFGAEHFGILGAYSYN